MPMFERILVGLDASPHSARVVAAASELALKTSASVLVAHIRDVPLPVAMAATAGRPGALPRGAVGEDDQAAQQLVQDAVRAFQEAGVEARGEVVSAWGATARELLKMADEFRADTIVVGHHGGAVSQILLGSVAYRIVHQASCPVLVVR
jgi:nucleotide-binding universal stress UspA family protein